MKEQYIKVILPPEEHNECNTKLKKGKNTTKENI